jgi:hypothetical protein
MRAPGRRGVGEMPLVHRGGGVRARQERRRGRGCTLEPALPIRVGHRGRGAAGSRAGTEAGVQLRRAYVLGRAPSGRGQGAGQRATGIGMGLRGCAPPG